VYSVQPTSRLIVNSYVPAEQAILGPVDKRMSFHAKLDGILLEARLMELIQSTRGFKPKNQLRRCVSFKDVGALKS
jgi:hypothetical protein